jgi:hypothetical protein
MTLAMSSDLEKISVASLVPPVGNGKDPSSTNFRLAAISLVDVGSGMCFASRPQRGRDSFSKCSNPARCPLSSSVLLAPSAPQLGLDACPDGQE